MRYSFTIDFGPAIKQISQWFKPTIATVMPFLLWFAGAMFVVADAFYKAGYYQAIVEGKHE